MPARRSYRRTYKKSSGKRLSRPAYALAKAIDDQAKEARFNDSVTALAGLAGAGPGMVGDRMRRRKEYLQMTGRGKYNFGHALNKFARGATGKALLNAGAGIADQYTGGLASTALQMSGYGMYTGRGAYTNELIDGNNADQVPSFSSTSDETGAVTISRKVYLGDVFGPTTTFNVQSYPINPGLESSFPWISQIASNYEEYTCIQLIYTFISTVADIGSTTGQIGTVIMATNYNPDRPIFQDKAEMMEYVGACSAKASDNLMHAVECDPDKLSGSEGKYIRSTPLPTTEDIKAYDHGTFCLAVSNVPTLYQNQQIGELWVSYTFQFRKPKNFTGRGYAISQDLYVSNNVGVGSPLGTRAALLSGVTNSLNCQLCSSLSTSNNPTFDIGITSQKLGIIFPQSAAGYYEIIYIVESATSLVATDSWAIIEFPNGGNITAVNDMYAAGSMTGDTPSSESLSSCPAGGANRCIAIFHVRLAPATNGINNAALLTIGSWSTTSSAQSQLIIREYNAIGSYKNQNQGTSDAPMLVNASGVVTAL